MTNPFRDGVEILGVSTKDNGNGTSTVSLVYRETAEATPLPNKAPTAPRLVLPWPFGKAHPPNTPKPQREQKASPQGLPWKKIFLTALAGTLIYACRNVHRETQLRRPPDAHVRPGPGHPHNDRRPHDLVRNNIRRPLVDSHKSR